MRDLLQGRLKLHACTRLPGLRHASLMTNFLHAGCTRVSNARGSPCRTEPRHALEETSQGFLQVLAVVARESELRAVQKDDAILAVEPGL